MERDTDAFVIWIEGPPGPAGADHALQGRVEHVQTSLRGSFANAEELLRFLSGHRRAAERSEAEG